MISTTIELYYCPKASLENGRVTTFSSPAIIFAAFWLAGSRGASLGRRKRSDVKIVTENLFPDIFFFLAVIFDFFF